MNHRSSQGATGTEQIACNRVSNCSCKSVEDTKIARHFFDFPEGFLWGAATSHFQVEGHPVEIEQRASDWSSWCVERGRISDDTNADQACEFFDRYASDIALCRNLNLNAFRLSLNWPALCPEPLTLPGRKRSLNKETVDYYRRILSSLKEQGITTFVTLFHFTLPSWLSERGGWLVQETVDEFEAFAQLAAESFSDLVDYWITLNEPLAYAYQGYISGVWPPGLHGNHLSAFKVVRNMLLGHARAYAALHHGGTPSKVSFTMHWRPF